jgi:glutathione S-transferase
MKLFYFSVAPNPTKVRVYLAEKGIDIETERVNLQKGEQKAEGFLARNAMGKLPVLELDDGSFINESLAIIEYIEERHPNPPLIGSDPETRARVRSIERHCDVHILMSIARYIHATNSPLGLAPKPQVAEQAQEMLHTALSVLDPLLAEREFVAGDRLTIADCTLWGGAGFAAFRGFDFDAGFTNVQRWREAFAKRPSANLPF